MKAATTSPAALDFFHNRHPRPAHHHHQRPPASSHGDPGSPRSGIVTGFRILSGTRTLRLPHSRRRAPRRLSVSPAPFSETSPPPPSPSSPPAYPIWYVQSTLAHADIFAAAFTLWALALYLETFRPSSATTTGAPFIAWPHRAMSGPPRNPHRAPPHRTSASSPSPSFSPSPPSPKRPPSSPPSRLALHRLYLLAAERENRRRDHLKTGSPALSLLRPSRFSPGTPTTASVTGFVFGNHLNSCATTPRPTWTRTASSLSLYHRAAAPACAHEHVVSPHGARRRLLSPSAPRELSASHAASSCSRSPSLLLVTNWIAFSMSSAALCSRVTCSRCTRLLLLLFVAQFGSQRTRLWPLLTARHRRAPSSSPCTSIRRTPSRPKTTSPTAT